jgi:hypothetical protein
MMACGARGKRLDQRNVSPRAWAETDCRAFGVLVTLRGFGAASIQSNATNASRATAASSVIRWTRAESRLEHASPPSS